jgi:AraC-like DNA-binding protein
MNKELFRDDKNNSLRISSLNSYDNNISFKGFAAKMVLSGKETYYVHNKKFIVEQNEYIVGNDETISSIIIKSPEVVKGLCLDVSEKIIKEVAEYNLEHADGFINFLLTDNLLINKYNAIHTSLGYALNDLKQRVLLTNDGQPNINSELFYSIAECIVTDQLSVYEKLGRINFKKQVTNEEIFRSLNTAKEYIDEHLFDNLNLDTLASSAFISKYHFMRLFKTVYNYSPYQYILQKKLVVAKALLQKGASVFDVSVEVGFVDVPTFSKAFKKLFGQSPSRYIPK